MLKDTQTFFSFLKTKNTGARDTIRFLIRTTVEKRTGNKTHEKNLHFKKNALNDRF